MFPAYHDRVSKVRAKETKGKIHKDQDPGKETELQERRPTVSELEGHTKNRGAWERGTGEEGIKERQKTMDA